MNPTEELLSQLEQVQWFANSGERCELLDNGPFERVRVEMDAIGSLGSTQWEDFKIEAYGDLTEFAALKNYDVYSQVINSIAVKAQHDIEERILALIVPSLPPLWSSAQSRSIISDLHYIAIEIHLSTHFKALPSRFRHLLKVYKSGHIPCGSSDYSASWPNQKILYW